MEPLFDRGNGSIQLRGILERLEETVPILPGDGAMTPAKMELMNPRPGVESSSPRCQKNGTILFPTGLCSSSQGQWNYQQEWVHFLSTRRRSRCRNGTIRFELMGRWWHTPSFCAEPGDLAVGRPPLHSKARLRVA